MIRADRQIRRRAGTALAIGLAAWCAGGVSAAAGEAAAPADTRLDLDTCLRRGLAGNPEVDARRFDAVASDAARRAVETGRWPRLYGEALWRRSDNQVIVFGDKLTAGEFTAADFALDTLNNPDPIDHGTLAVGIDLPIDLGGRVGASIDAARGMQTAAEARWRAAREDLVERLTEAFYLVAFVDATADVADAARARAARQEAVASARTAGGDALRSETLRARAARLERERDLTRRRADAALARTRLAVLMGEPDRRIEATTPLPEAPEPIGLLEDWLDGLPDRADLEAARRDQEAAGGVARAARAARAPEMAGVARYERNANGFDGGDGSYLVGLSLRWNAFDPGRGPRIEEAEARSAASAARARVLADGARLEIERAWRDAQVADAAIMSAAEGAVAAAEANRIAADRYAGGLLSLTDLLEAERAARESELATAAARFDAVIARLRLHRSAGRLEVPAPEATDGGTGAPASGGARR